LGGSPYSYP
jgi:hypothetical protein